MPPSEYRPFIEVTNVSADTHHSVSTEVIVVRLYIHFLFVQTVVMKQELNASKVFSSMTVFDMLRNQLAMVTRSITNLIAGKVSLERVADFLAKVGPMSYT